MKNLLRAPNPTTLGRTSPARRMLATILALAMAMFTIIYLVVAASPRPAGAALSPGKGTIGDHEVVDAAHPGRHRAIDLPKPKNGGVYVVAHRGVHDGMPENSMPAYRRAIALGCDFVEIDVRSTLDSVLVSIHNDRIDAYVENDTGLVADRTLQQLKKLDIGWSHPGWRGTRIPSVREILRLCKGNIGIYLDLKEPLVAPLVAEIRRFDMVGAVLWYIPAGREDQIGELQRLCPECLLMPDPGRIAALPSMLRSLNPGVVATDMGTLSADFVRQSHAHHAIVIVDERKGTEDEWQRILRMGTDGIQTDDPEGLIRFLRDGRR